MSGRTPSKPAGKGGPVLEAIPEGRKGEVRVPGSGPVTCSGPELKNGPATGLAPGPGLGLKPGGWFLASEIPNGNPTASRFHVIPVPFEESVSYGGGTAAGPQAILEASSQLELWNGTNEPAALGIHTWDPVRRLQRETVPDFLDRLASIIAIALDVGAFPFVLGGEHALTFAPAAACRERFGRIGIVQFDAHADLRLAYEGNPFSHASVMRRIVDELELPLYQVGLRGISREEDEYRAARRIPGVSARAAAAGIDRLELPDGFPEQVYITFDVDGLDPAIMPATGTPVPGGLGWYQALGMIESVVTGREVVGFDLVELAPYPGLHFCEFTAAQLVYEVMGMLSKREP